MTHDALTADVHRLLHLYRSGTVERFHNKPHHRPYTTAHHQWGVAVLIMDLHPDPSRALLKAALTHDVHELWMGDEPWAAKKLRRSGLEDKELESEVCECLIGRDWSLELNDAEKLWLKCCDKLELLLYCHHEMLMGNKFVAQTFYALRKYLSTDPEVPGEIRCRVERFINPILMMVEPEYWDHHTDFGAGV